MEKVIDQQLEKIKALNEEYKLKIQNDSNFANQKEIVNIIEKIGFAIDKIHWENRKEITYQSNRLEYMCNDHDWEIDHSMYDGHTSRFCKKCGYYLC
jgi:hypothetical protein